jgi:hypothetical protein
MDEVLWEEPSCIGTRLYQATEPNTWKAGGGGGDDSFATG